MTENLEMVVLTDVVARLESAGIEYMLTGSMAMNFYAQPRMTRDIDIVAALSKSEVEKVIDTFEDAYYLSADAVSNAVRHRKIFNLVHYENVVKIDVIVRKDSEYRLLEFDRRQRIRVGNLDTWIVSKEDLILSKLSWAQETMSEMQLNDVRTLLAAKPDMEYLQAWSSRLRLQSLLEKCQNE